MLYFTYFIIFQTCFSVLICNKSNIYETMIMKNILFDKYCVKSAIFPDILLYLPYNVILVIFHNEFSAG